MRTTIQQRVIKRLEDALAQARPHPRSRDTLRARADSVLSTLAGVDCAILIANNYGRYVHLNDRATRLTGYTEAELRRRSVWDLTPGVDVETARHTWRDVSERRPHAGPLRHPA